MSLVRCAECAKEFDWNTAYNQRDTPGTHNITKKGNWWPRVFCPYCGFLIAERGIDKNQEWMWYKQNAEVNVDRDLPHSAITPWGKPIPVDARATILEDHIDIELIRQLRGELPSEEAETAKLDEKQLSAAEILAEVNKELDSFLRSSKTFAFYETKPIFEILKSYVNGEGKSDPEAIALLGLVQFYSGKRDMARDMFERGSKLDESCALCHLGLGILDYWKPDTAKRGVDRLSKAISLDPSLIDTYVWKARIEKQKLNDPQSAWYSLQEAICNVGDKYIKQHPRGHLLFVELGELCVFDDMGDLNEAIDYFETAMKMVPDYHEPPMYLTTIYDALDDSTEVVRTRAAYIRKDVRGIELSSESISAIKKFVTKSLIKKKRKDISRTDKMSSLYQWKEPVTVHNLRKLKTRISGLPDNYPPATNNSFDREGVFEAKDKLRMIYNNIVDVIIALESRLDINNNPIAKSEIKNGMMRLISLTQKPGFLEMMEKILNDQGIGILKESMAELRQTADRID